MQGAGVSFGCVFSGRYFRFLRKLPNTPAIPQQMPPTGHGTQNISAFAMNRRSSPTMVGSVSTVGALVVASYILQNRDITHVTSMTNSAVVRGVSSMWYN